MKTMHINHPLIRSVSILSLSALALAAQPLMGAAAAAAGSSSVAGKTSLFELISQGGWAMIPLGATSMVMLFLFVQGLMLTRTKRHRFPPALRVVVDARGGGQAVEPALASMREGLPDDTPARGVMEALQRQARRNRDHQSLDDAVMEAADTVHDGNGQWIQYLNVVAAIAPMIGLLGTVSGMIGAFQKIGVTGMGKPEELAGNIGEALITTATGLVIAIPAMIAFFVLRNRNENARRLLVEDGLQVAALIAAHQPCTAPDAAADHSLK